METAVELLSKIVEWKSDWMVEWTDGFEYPLDCYDYLSTCGANIDPYGPFGAFSVTKANAKMVHLWFHNMRVTICFQCP